MKYFSRILPVLLIVLLALPVTFLTSCGSDSNPTTAPATGSITVNPDTLKLTVGVGVCDGAVTDTLDEPVIVTVLDANGAPQNHITIFIGLDWSPTTSSTFVATRLFDADQNPPVEVSVPFKTTTGDFGTKNLILRLDTGGCKYSGSLTATSGTLRGQLAFDVATQ